MNIFSSLARASCRWHERLGCDRTGHYSSLCFRSAILGNLTMRTVLCYGDSNTHGQIPGGLTLDRYTLRERWPGVLAAELGNTWHVIEEGLSGRTTVHDDPIEGAGKIG